MSQFKSNMDGKELFCEGEKAYHRLSNMSNSGRIE